MSRLAVVFPGVGYHVDKPLLYYSRKLARELGYEVVDVPYKNLPISSSIKGDAGKMRAVFEDALRQAGEILTDVDFASYDRIVFIGKSVGTVVAGAYARQVSVRLSAEGIDWAPDMLLYTPVEATFQFLGENKGNNLTGLDFDSMRESSSGSGIVFHGTNDGWVETSVVKNGCDRLKLPLHIIENANHSLETGNAMADILYLHEVMRLTREFLE